MSDVSIFLKYCVRKHSNCDHGTKFYTLKMINRTDPSMIESAMRGENMSVVIMSVYQTIENLEELDVVLIVLEDVLFVDTTKHDMIDASTTFCPFLSWHVRMLSCLTVQI